jgi:thiol-disulfide isomerase/thioredoxin
MAAMGMRPLRNIYGWRATPTDFEVREMEEQWQQGRSAARRRLGGRRIACLLGLAWMLCPGVAPRAWAGPVANLKFQDMAGHTERLGSLRGRIAVVNFWATWCAPCRAELPMLSRVEQQYAGRGVEFVAISVDSRKDQAKIARYMAEEKPGLRVWVGADLDTLGRLGLGNVVPATLVLDAKGDAVGRIEGEAEEADVRGYLDWLLRGRRGKAPPARIKRY